MISCSSRTFAVLSPSEEGLAVMVQILASSLTGGSFSPIRNREAQGPVAHNIGHLFIVIDPSVFRDLGDFERDVDQVMDVLKASNLGAPVTLADARSAPAMAYFEAARRLAGEIVPVTVPGEKRGIFGKLFGRKAA